MSRVFDDDLLDQRLRAMLDERAEEVAAAARSAEQVAAGLAPRLRSGHGLGAGVAIRLAWLAVLGIVLLALLFGLTIGTSTPPIRLTLAVDMPVGAEPGTDAIVNAIRLAVLDSGNRGGRFVLELPDSLILDDAVAGQPDDATGAAIARQAAADPSVVALIGPYNSSVAEAEIPVTNAAGLLQCGPSNTAPGLTIGERASLMRPRPNQPNYIRVVATDDGLARGAARFLTDSLGARSVYVVDSWPQQAAAGQPYVSDFAGVFAATFQGRGGRLVGQAPFPPSAGADELTTLVAAVHGAAPDAVFFHGPGAAGARLLAALTAAGSGALPVVGVDPLLDGPRSATGSFLNLAGDDAARAYAAFPAAVDATAGSRFEAAYRARFGAAPPRYAAAAYACVEVIVAALEHLDVSARASPAAWREALRATVVGGGPFQTVLGSIAFDGSGDVKPAAVSVYGYDGTSLDWTFREDVDASP